MSKVKILIVEDEAIGALDLQQRLSNLGYTAPDIVSSGEEAVRQAHQTRPDLVLMDIMLHGEIDGVTAAEKIRILLDIPVVYLTAYADKATLQRAKITEPYGYIVKPFKERELYITIDMALYKHQMEKKLRESERWLATTLRSIGDAAIATDNNARITFMNPVAERLTGWKEKEALAKPLTEVFRIINRDTRQPVENPTTRVFREGITVGLANHTMLIARDGREIPIDDSAAPIKDDPGNIIGVILVFRDVTEREKVEAQRQELTAELERRVRERTLQLQETVEELRRSNEDLEKFAYISSHDLQEPLRMVGSFVQLLEKNYKDKLGPEANEYIHFAMEGAQRMSRLIKDLLAYSRVNTKGKLPQPVSAEKALNLVRQNLHLTLTETEAQITHDPLPTILADETQLTQVFQNLIGNAVKFRKDTEPPRIHISAQRTDGQWLFSVRDNGIGIEPEYYEQIFHPFKRLHANRSRYPGSGVGLAIVKRIVERHHGQVSVDSKFRVGTTFYFTLPIDYPNSM